MHFNTHQPYFSAISTTCPQEHSVAIRANQQAYFISGEDLDKLQRLKDEHERLLASAGTDEVNQAKVNRAFGEAKKSWVTGNDFESVLSTFNNCLSESQ